MKLLSLACLVSAAAASVIPRQAPATFKLKTIESSNKPEHNGLFITAFHTGAGENDVVADPTDSGYTLSLNGTNLLFNLPTTIGGWYTQLDDTKYYACTHTIISPPKCQKMVF